jgi:hypothetical protein
MCNIKMRTYHKKMTAKRVLNQMSHRCTGKVTIIGAMLLLENKTTEGFQNVLKKKNMYI